MLDKGEELFPSFSRALVHACIFQHSREHTARFLLQYLHGIFFSKAVSTKNTIIITEEVKYHENEKMELPSSLVSGTYNYTFRLDNNYNYVLVSKTYINKY